MEIKELILLTNDLPETKRFYEQTIGCRKIAETETRISFAAGTSILTFELNNHLRKPKYHFAFNIPSNKLNDALNWILKRTSLILAESSFIAHFDNWNAKAIYFFDNNYNILEFISRSDLNNPTDKVFSVDSILSINEIGIVADEPIQLAENIIEKTQIDFFVRGPKREDFVAVGDDKGLFVISNSKRNWYPTQELAEKWKIRCMIKVDGKEFELEYN